MPAGVQKISLGPPEAIPKRGDSLFLVVLEQIEPGHRSGHHEGREERNHRSGLELGQHHHAGEDESEDHRRPEIGLKKDQRRWKRKDQPGDD